MYGISPQCSPPTPSCIACRISRSCAARRIRRSWSSARRRSAMRRSPSPTNARSPASCARTSRRRTPGCRSSSAASSRSIDGLKLVLLATDRASYGDLSQLITRGRRNAAKGSYALTRDDVAALAPRLPRAVGAAGSAATARVRRRRDARRTRAGSPTSFAGPRLDRRRAARARRRPRAARASARRSRGDRPAAGRRRRRAHARARAARAAGHADRDPPAARRSPNAATRCIPNGERHLRSRARLATLYPRELLAETRRASPSAARSRSTSCATSIRRRSCPPGETPASHLRKLTDEGLARRYRGRRCRPRSAS